MDYILAFSETLLNINAEIDALVDIQTMATQIIEMLGNAETPPERNLDLMTDQTSLIMSELTANELLSDECGQFAMKVMYRFLNYNYEWIQGCLTSSDDGHPLGQAEEVIPPLIRPWGSDLYPPSNPIAMMNQIGIKKSTIFIPEYQEDEIS